MSCSKFHSSFWMCAKWRLTVLTASEESAAYIFRVKVNRKINWTPKMEAEIFSETSKAVHCGNTRKPQIINHVSDKIYFLLQIIHLIV